MSKNPSLDSLFQTKAGNTPATRWGLPTSVKLCKKRMAEGISLLESARSACEKGFKGLAAARNAILQGRALSVTQHPLKYLLTAVELPLTLAYQIPELQPELLEGAATSLHEFCDQILDTDGTPDAENLGEFRLFLASFVRMRLMNEVLGCFSAEMTEFFDAMVRRALCLTRADGSQMLSKEGETPWCPEMFVAALQLDSEKDDKRLGVSILPGFNPAKRIRSELLPNGSNLSEWGRVATLRQGWSGTHTAVCWNGDSLDLELASSAADPLISGNWKATVTVDGERSQPKSDWEVQNWTDEGDSILLVLEQAQTLCTLQRHVLLVRNANEVLLADTVLPCLDNYGEGQKWSYTARWPLAQGVRTMSGNDATEIRFESGGTLMPLALPEWKFQCTAKNRFRQVGNMLEYTYTQQDGGLFVPLWIDFSAGRRENIVTWRRLTVGENMHAVAPSVASGFRVQTGESQWLLYCSLVPPANRSVLGHNLNETFRVGRFLEDGLVESMADY